MRVAMSIVCLMIILAQFKKNRLLSSSTLWIFIYWVTFAIAPLLTDLYHPYADTYAFIGSLGFALGCLLMGNYTLCFGKSRVESRELNVDSTKLIVRVSLIASIIALFIYLGSYGIKAVISGSITTSSLLHSGESAGIGDLFSYCVLIYGFLIFEMLVANEGKICISFVLHLCIYTALTVLFLFRREYLVILICMILFYLLRNKSSLSQMKYIIPAFFGLIFLMFIMVFTRTQGIMGGIKLFTETYNSEVLKDFMTHFLDISASYSAFVRELNVEGMFVNPIVYLKPLFAFIPRSVWPTKPLSLNVQVLQQIDYAAYLAGGSTGVSILGEGYAVLGKLGIFIYPFVWGILCKSFDNKYYNHNLINERSLRTVLYLIFSVFMVIECQRGNTQSAIQDMIIFVVILWIFEKINNKRIKFHT